MNIIKYSDGTYLGFNEVGGYIKTDLAHAHQFSSRKFAQLLVSSNKLDATVVTIH